jgi:hypothetical protein
MQTHAAPVKQYNNRARKVLAEKIKQLGQTEHDELLRILKSHGVPYTQNSNGVFINISAVDNDAISQLDDFVKFCIHNMQELDDYDKRLNECKQNAAGIITNMSYSVATTGVDKDSVEDDNVDVAASGNKRDREQERVDVEDKDSAEDVDDWDGFIDKYSVDAERVRAFSASISAFKNPASLSSGATKKKTSCNKFNTAKKKYAKKRSSDAGVSASSATGKAAANQQQLPNVLEQDCFST